MTISKTAIREIDKRDLIEGLIKGLEVIQAFSDFHPRLTVSEVAERAGLTRAAARRYLLTLTHVGMATREGRHFRLAPPVTTLGSYLNPPPPSTSATAFLDRLGPHLAESGNVTVLVLDGANMVPLNAPAPSTG